MFTVRRLGVPDPLARTMSCTNIVESMISVVRDLSGRVKNWRDATMVRRWVGTGMLEAERSFRRVRGCKEMAVLVKAVRAEVASRLERSAEEPAMPSRNVCVTASCAACGGPSPEGRAKLWCSDACRQAAWRRRHQPEQEPPELPPRDAQGEHGLSVPRLRGPAPRCAVLRGLRNFMRRLGPGGNCPCCDEPITFQELASG